MRYIIQNKTYVKKDNNLALFPETLTQYMTLHVKREIAIVLHLNPLLHKFHAVFFFLPLDK
jgi:hypothetical protein